MGYLSGKRRQTGSQFAAEEHRQGELRELNRRAQNGVNIRAMLKRGIDRPLSQREVNAFAGMTDCCGEVD